MDLHQKDIGLVTSCLLGQGQGSSRPRPRPEIFVLEVSSRGRGQSSRTTSPRRVVRVTEWVFFSAPSVGQLRSHSTRQIINVDVDRPSQVDAGVSCGNCAPAGVCLRDGRTHQRSRPAQTRAPRRLPIHSVKWRHRICGHDTFAILWV